MHFIYNLLFLIAGWKWGKWREWRKYYSTILFFILCDFFANILTYNYPLWRYQESIFATNILTNHSYISIMIMFIVYPATTLIYLGHFPKGTGKKVLWVLFWVALYWGVEFVNLHYFKLIRHENGWSMGWSLAFNIVMFSTVWAHYRKPILAWSFAIIWSFILIMYFNIPLNALP
ncbi:CBO0543 family protein [Paucisalibacillus sp. EB02]|uniref:CBO0543 family protein n=1 Tax=Paucisalibacillus sp. EB02 TaxID=1347087 RepID=UPI0005A9BC73|nr:CBO0543 family protein [Paucisalibacillus sp. EB02]